MEGKGYAYLFVSKDSEALLCQNFQRDLEQQIGLTIYGKVSRFKDLFEVIMKEAKRRHLTIVFDEFQTLCKINPAIFIDTHNGRWKMLVQICSLSTVLLFYKLLNLIGFKPPSWSDC